MMYGIGLHIPYLEIIHLYKVIQLATERGNSVTYYYQQLYNCWLVGTMNTQTISRTGLMVKSLSFSERENTSAVPPHRRAQGRLGVGSTVGR